MMHRTNRSQDTQSEAVKDVKLSFLLIAPIGLTLFTKHGWFGILSLYLAALAASPILGINLISTEWMAVYFLIMGVGYAVMYIVGLGVLIHDVRSQP